MSRCNSSIHVLVYCKDIEDSVGPIGHSKPVPKVDVDLSHAGFYISARQCHYNN